MISYCVMEWKRLLRYLPGAVCALLVLAGGFFLAYSGLTAEESAQDIPLRVAMVGTAEDELLQLGLTAVRSMDSARYSLELVEMTEPEARSALARQEVGAYVVIPEGFMESALGGELLPIRFVSTTGAGGLVSIFKEEVSAVIGDVVLYAQQGVYGMQKAMQDEQIGGRGGKMTALAVRYADMVLSRDKLYTLRELGISHGLTLEQYLRWGFSVALLHLLCLSFAPMMIRSDLSLERMLTARGRSAALQALVSLAVYGLGLLCLSLTLGASWRVLPVAAAVAAFSFCLYALSRELVGGVLLQFFLSVGLCFLGGCFYPVFFFPVTVQRIARWLPTGLALRQLSGEGDVWTVLALLGFALVFALGGVAARVRAVKEARV